MPTNGVIPVYRLSMTGDGAQWKGIPFQPSQPVHLNALALTAIDAAQHVFLVTRKDDSTGAEPLLQVIRIDTDGNSIAPAVILTRLSGAPARLLCKFFAVSPSGKRWWTIRASREGMGVKQSPAPVILAVHSEDGHALQEWVLPVPGIASVYDLKVPDDTTALVQVDGRRMRYTLPHPSQKDIGEEWNMEDWTTPDGSILGIRPIVHLSNTNNRAEYAIVQYDTQSFVSTRKATFQASLPTAPEIFATDGTRIYFYTALIDKKNKFLNTDGAKAVFTVSTTGDVQSLFLTSAYNTNQVFRYGDLFCLDRHQQIIFDRMLYRKDQPYEYQIVKASRLPRWKFWLRWSQQ